MKKLSLVLLTIGIVSSLLGCELIPDFQPTDNIPPDPEETIIDDLAIDPLVLTGETISCSFSWNYGGSEWDWQINIPKGYYDYYKGMPRTPTDNYSVYITHPEDDEFIGMLVDRLMDSAQQKRYSEYETVNFVVSFVQSLPYTPDNVTTAYDEYPRYPIETLVDNGGDCEDTSILMAALLEEMDYGVVLLSFPSHMAVGVYGENLPGTYYRYNGRDYYYLETTGEGWLVGSVPDWTEPLPLDTLG